MQALFPRGAEPLPNRVGTAPGIWMRIGRATIACLPGVPSEMRVMYGEQVVPRLRKEGWVERIIVHRKINLFGKGEADVEAQAMDLTVRGRVPEVGITAHDGTISFRITASGTVKEAQASLEKLEPTAQVIYQRFGSLILGEDSVDVPEALLAQLVRTGATLATAVSCTGGQIAHMITTLAGVSPIYLGGVVCYANQAKTEFLGVPLALLEAHGAVSPEVAAAMAQGVRNRLGSDLGLSATGVAGVRTGGNGGETGRPRLPGPGHFQGGPDTPARHRFGATARRHPATLFQGRPQLGAADAAGKPMTRHGQLEPSRKRAGAIGSDDCRLYDHNPRPEGRQPREMGGPVDHATPA